MKSLKGINWNKFIHAGLTPAQQIIMLGDSPSSQGTVAPPTGSFRITEAGDFRITEAGDFRITE